MRNELVKTCVDAGREVESVVISRLKASDSAGPLNDAQLEELFEPVVAFVEDSVEKRIRQEQADVDAMWKKRVEKDQKEREALKIRDGLDGKVVINVNGKRRISLKHSAAQRLRASITEGAGAEAIPNFKSAIVSPIRDPLHDMDDIRKDTGLYSQFHHSIYWERYCPELSISVAGPAELLIGGNIESLANYVDAVPDISTLDQVAELVEASKNIVQLDNNSNVIGELLRVAGTTLDTPSREQFVSFLIALCKSEALCETAKLLVSFLEREASGTCAAYDCFTDIPVMQTAAACSATCRARICSDCAGMKRTCADH